MSNSRIEEIRKRLSPPGIAISPLEADVEFLLGEVERLELDIEFFKGCHEKHCYIGKDDNYYWTDAGWAELQELRACVSGLRNERNFYSKNLNRMVEEHARLKDMVKSHTDLLRKFKAFWLEHQRTKFLSDGSHFQADLKLDELFIEIMAALGEEK